MKKLSKIILILGGTAAALLVAAAIALKIYLPPEKAKILLSKFIESRFHRQVKLGEVSVSLITGLTVKDFKLSERPDFSQGTFISSDRLRVAPRLLPLLSKKILIKEVELLKPEISLTRSSDGKTFNFSDMVPAGSASTAEKKPVSPLTFLVSSVHVEDGGLQFMDQSPAGQSVNITDFDASLRNVTLAGPMQMKTDFRAKMKDLNAQAHFDGALNYLQETLTIHDGQIRAGSGPEEESVLKVTGVVTHLFSSGQEPSPIFDLKTEIPQLTTSLVKKWVSLPPGVLLTGVYQGEAEVNGSPQKINFSAKINLDHANLSYGDSFQKANGHPMKIEAAGVFSQPAATDLKQVKLILGGIQLEGTGRYASEPALLQLDLKSNSFALGEVESLVPSARGTNLMGQSVLQVSLRQKGAAPVQINGDLALKGAGVKYEQIQLSNLQAPIQFTADSAIISKLTGQLNSSDMTLTGSLKKFSSRPVIHTDIHLSLLDLNALMPSPSVPAQKKTDAGFLNGALAAVFLAQEASAAAPSAPDGFMARVMDISGTLLADEVRHEYMKGKNLKVEWNLAGRPADLGSLSGKASLRQGPGEVQNIQKLTEGSKAARIFLIPLTLLQKLDKATHGALKLPPLDRLSFQDIVGDYTFRAGVMTVQKFVMNGAPLSADMTGTIGLVGSQPVNLKAMTQLPKGSVGGTLGELLEDAQGRTSLVMNVTGTVMEPSVKVETKEIKQKAIETIKEKVGEEQIKKAKDFLKGLLH